MPVKKSLSISQDTLCKNDCQHGAFSIIFIGERHNVVDICLSIAKFYTYESCGKCTPCREGTIRLVNLLKKIKNREADESDVKLLKEFAEHIQETSLCGLGQSCGNHILTSLKHFRKDYRRYLK